MPRHIASLLLVILGLVWAGAALAEPASAPTSSPASAPASAPAAAGPATVSTSGGVKGGAVVLWPRVIPSSQADALKPIAAQLQDQMEKLVKQTLPNAPIDKRPAPQRVCPQGGCEGLGVGVLLIHNQNGCAALGLLSSPGRTIISIHPWAGEVELKQTRVEFREPPESQVIVKDFVPCDQLLAHTQANEPNLLTEIKAQGTLAAPK
jgi:hypothetical protein